MIVVDASVAAAWFFNDEVSEYAAFAMRRIAQESAAVPAIFPVEVGNAILIGGRRGRLSSEETRKAVDQLAELPIVVQRQSLSIGDDLALAEKHSLSVYDAQYLALAMGQRVDLFTLDQRLAAAAEAENVLGRVPG
ncbi:MAG TPA: type II toxin-antitoxin system VapC family toxin [Candidatus Baltobacteraceae bacterium]